MVNPLFERPLSRRRAIGLALAGATGVPLLATGTASAAPAALRQPARTPSAAYRWIEIALEATARDVLANGARPTTGSRHLGIVTTAMYDAWAAYDNKADGTRLKGRLRRPGRERTTGNKSIAVGQAAYLALVDQYPAQAQFFAERARAEGLDPDRRSTDPSTPVGVATLATEALLAYRHTDGSNQFGTVAGSSGVPYSDYTGYVPVNTAARVVDPDRWQPITFTRPDGSTVAPGFLTAHWSRVTPFALTSSSQFRPPPPPRVADSRLRAETDEVIAYNASLTVEQKAIVEFMRDGPRSTGQAGHWLEFAQMVSLRDRFDIDRDVTCFFAVGTVSMDAFIAAWDAKRFYDTSRPWTLVRHYYGGQQLRGWGGPGRGVVTLPAESWHPYSPLAFVTPPFPGYVSGHSTISAAAARILELFTGSDAFGVVETRVAGAETEAAFSCGQIQSQEGQPPQPADLDCTVTIPIPTFSGLGELAGISRIYGGYHVQADNVAGLALGRRVADHGWRVVRDHIDGRT
jgi:hypothetical protein